MKTYKAAIFVPALTKMNNCSQHHVYKICSHLEITPPPPPYTTQCIGFGTAIPRESGLPQQVKHYASGLPQHLTLCRDLPLHYASDLPLGLYNYYSVQCLGFGMPVQWLW